MLNRPSYSHSKLAGAGEHLSQEVFRVLNQDSLLPPSYGTTLPSSFPSFRCGLRQAGDSQRGVDYGLTQYHFCLDPNHASPIPVVFTTSCIQVFQPCWMLNITTQRRYAEFSAIRGILRRAKEAPVTEFFITTLQSKPQDATGNHDAHVHRPNFASYATFIRTDWRTHAW
ncbi:hypothetical protein AB1N83_009932 [Pleurotus pulmonarius]